MQTGRYTVDIVNVGTIYKDGGIEFAGLSKSEWSEYVIPDDNNRIPLGVNFLLIRGAKGNIVVDTGYGTTLDENRKKALNVKRMATMSELLKPHGISPEEINYVVLTHLHFEHCGGASEYEDDDIVPAFKNAKYIIQKDEWETVLSPGISAGECSVKNYLPLLESGNLSLISGNVELLPGVFIEATGGHTMGHQIVFVEDTIEDLIYSGDICPTLCHLSSAKREAFDSFPIETVKIRKKLLCKASQNNCLFVFAHDLHGKFYRINEENNEFKAVEA